MECHRSTGNIKKLDSALTIQPLWYIAKFDLYLWWRIRILKLMTIEILFSVNKMLRNLINKKTSNSPICMITIMEHRQMFLWAFCARYDWNHSNVWSDKINIYYNQEKSTYLTIKMDISCKCEKCIINLYSLLFITTQIEAYDRFHCSCLVSFMWNIYKTSKSFRCLSIICNFRVI